MGNRKAVFVGLGALVVAAAVVLTVIVASGGSDDPTAAPPPTTSRPKPSLAPLQLADQPLWTSGDVLVDVGMRDGVVLTMHQKQDHLTLTDVATGKARWSLKMGDLPGGGSPDIWQVGAPLLVGNGDSLAALVTYREYHADPDTHDQGLALLSGKDGSVLWKTPTLSSEDEFAHLLWAADDTTALVSVSPTNDLTDVGQVRAIAYDIATGTKRWEQSGIWPYAIAGDTVLGEESVHTVASRGGYGPQPLAKVIALDLATGEKRWDLTARFAGSNLVGVGGDVAVVRGPAERSDTRNQNLVVAAKTSQELASISDHERIDSCASDGLLLIACHLTNGETYRIATIRIDDGTTTLSERALASPAEVDAVWQGRIFAHRQEGGYDVYFTLDQAGHVIDDELPGKLVAISDQHALFSIAGDAPTGAITAYNLTP